MTDKQAAQTKLTAGAMKPLLSGLRDSGLTTYESESYLSLIQNPNISATQLCNETGIPDSKVYFALEELQRKGLIVVSEGTPRRYFALRPKDALSKLKSLLSEEFEGQLEKLDQLTIAMEPLYTRSQRDDVELAYVVKGLENVSKRMMELLKSAKREVVIFIPSRVLYERYEGELGTLRQKGVKVRLAVPSALRKKAERMNFSEIRETSTQCEDCWLAVVDDKTVISSSQWTTERCHAILTQDPVLVAMSREYYESPRCCIAA